MLDSANILIQVLEIWRQVQLSPWFWIYPSSPEDSKSVINFSLLVLCEQEDSVYLSGAHPVAAGTVTIDCQIKIVDKTTDHEFYIDSSGIDVLNFKFKKR